MNICFTAVEVCDFRLRAGFGRFVVVNLCSLSEYSEGALFFLDSCSYLLKCPAQPGGRS